MASSSSSDNVETEVPELEGLSEDEQIRVLTELVEQERAKRKIVDLREELRSLRAKSTSEPSTDKLLESSTSAATVAQKDGLFTPRTSKDPDGNILVMGNRDTHDDIVKATQIYRRIFSRRRWPVFSTRGLHFTAAKILPELQARYKENMGGKMSALVTSSQVDLKSLDAWISTGLFLEVKNFEAVTDASKFDLMIGMDNKDNDYDHFSLSHCAPPASNSRIFDLASHELAQQELTMRIANRDKLMACVHAVEWFQSSKDFIIRIQYGDLNMLPVAWVRFEVEDVHCKLKRILSSPILDNLGNEVSITCVEDSVNIYKKLLVDIDFTARQQSAYERILAHQVSRGPLKAELPSTSEADRAVPGKPSGADVTVNTRGKPPRKKLTPSPSTAPVFQAVIGAAPVPLLNVAPGSVGRTKSGGLCVMYLAETSGLFPGVGCSFGLKCRFRHEAVAGVSKAEALSTLEKGKGKLSADQATDLEAYVTANCT